MAFIQKLAYMYVRLFIRLNSFVTIPIIAFSHHIGLRATQKNAHDSFVKKSEHLNAIALHLIYKKWTQCTLFKKIKRARWSEFYFHIHKCIYHTNTPGHILDDTDT